MLQSHRRRLLGKYGGFLAFVLPAMIIYTIFVTYPLFGGTFVMSLKKYNVIKGQSSFVGLQNFITIFNSADFWTSFVVTIKYVIAVVLAANVIALLLAILIESIQNKFIKSVSRNLFFLPYIVSGLIVGYLWRFMFTNVWPELANLLGLTKLASVSWFGDYSMALLALIIESVWKELGFLLLLYIAGLQAIPTDVMEASALDGCSVVQRTFHIVIPMLMSTISVNLFLSISNAFKQFDLAYVNNGGPGSATALLSYRIYKEAFVNYQYGSACAMAVGLMVIIGIFIIAQQMLTKEKEATL